jgi:hypothetical protein
MMMSTAGGSSETISREKVKGQIAFLEEGNQAEDFCRKSLTISVNFAGLSR